MIHEFGYTREPVHQYRGGLLTKPMGNAQRPASHTGILTQQHVGEKGKCISASIPNFPSAHRLRCVRCWGISDSNPGESGRGPPDDPADDVSPYFPDRFPI